MRIQFLENSYSLFNIARTASQPNRWKAQHLIQSLLWRGNFSPARAVTFAATALCAGTMAATRSETEEIEENNQRLKQLFKTLLACPDAKALYQEVLRNGPIDIRLVDPSYAPEGSTVDLVDRAIFINRKAPNWEHHLLLQLANLTQIDRAKQIVKDACSHSLDEHVKVVQDIQKESTEKVRKVACSCVRDGHWPLSWNTYNPLFDSNSNYPHSLLTLPKEERIQNPVKQSSRSPQDTQPPNWEVTEERLKIGNHP